MINQLEQAQNTYDEALARVERGEEWLRTHRVTDPQYAQARRLLEQRRAEMEQAQQALDAAHSAFMTETAQERGWAWDENTKDRPASLDCAVCGKPVFASGQSVVYWEEDGQLHDADVALPGHRVHFNCM